MTDVAVVGAGPNGLAAAVIIARAGLDVEVYEAGDAAGGGARTRELMEPGHHYDVCSAVHPMALGSPFFRKFGLADRVSFTAPEISYAHPLDGGRAAAAFRDLQRTVNGLGPDGSAYRRLMEPLVERIHEVSEFALGSLMRIPQNPLAAARFGAAVLEQGTSLWNHRFSTEEAAALFTGVAAHPVGSLPSIPAAGAGLLLGALAHAGGWPIPTGGSQAIAEAMVQDLQSHGGRVITGHHVESLSALRAKTVLLDVSPPTLLALAGDKLPGRYARALQRFRFGGAACKVDFILSGPVPWTADGLSDAGTLHLGGSRAEIVTAEHQVASGVHPESPYVLVSQPSEFDSGRAPAGRHILWTYCHVPNGSSQDMTEAVTRQIERFAPGFRDVVVRSQATTAVDLARYNANYVGGDFAGGATTLWQTIARPNLAVNPWKTPVKGVYLCSASTPPGPGVHGMGGFHAAKLALRKEFGLGMPDLSPGA